MQFKKIIAVYSRNRTKTVSKVMTRRPDDEDSPHLRNVGQLLPDCTAQIPEGRNFRILRLENLKYSSLWNFVHPPFVFRLSKTNANSLKQ
jgi:hypothetical protein